jgi:hypothetical protein
VEFVLDKQKKISAHDHAENIVMKAFERGALFLQLWQELHSIVTGAERLEAVDG